MHPRSDSRPSLVIVGAGPAGLTAAIVAARAGNRVTVCEQLGRAGAKLEVTGGGRANLTNLLPREEFMAGFGRQGRFILPALEALGPPGLRDFMKALGVPTEAPDGLRVYPKSNRAQDVLEGLLKECERLNVDLQTGVRVSDLILENGRVRGVMADWKALSGERVLIACGGKSYAELGGTGGGYRLALRAGHTLVAPVPALVPLVTGETWPRTCAGISLPAVVLNIAHAHGSRGSSSGALLFTHRGLSGPAALNVSGRVARLLLARESVPVRLDLFSGTPAAAWQKRLDSWRREQGKKQLTTLLANHMPHSLAEVACTENGCRPNLRPAELTVNQRDSLSRWLAEIPLTIVSTEGFEKAIVTSGGGALKEVNPKTLESRLVKGLYFAGEVLDLDGPCGGFNLQWAFSSGWLAGTSAGRVGR
jgi:predicted Rossmann fold flavoprotein